jgi:hypothetical protein
MRGKRAIGPRPGSGKLPLFLEVAAVALTTSGQSFIIPRGPGAKDGTPFGCFELLTVCFFGFLVEQQSCELAAWQLSAAIIALAECSAAIEPSAPMAELLQPNKQPPAIQIDTLNASRNRTAFIERNELIFARKSTPPPELLSRSVRCWYTCRSYGAS